MKKLALLCVLVGIGLAIAALFALEWREDDRLPNVEPSADERFAA